TTLDLLPDPVCHLIDVRLLQADLCPACVHDEISLRVQVQSVGPFHPKPDPLRVRSGSNDEVKFELPLIAVIDQVHAGVDVPVLDLRVGWNVGAPLRRIVANKIVAPSAQFFNSSDARRGVGAEELHAQYGALQRLAPFPLCRGWAIDASTGTRALAQRHHRLGRGQAKGIAAAAGEELDLWIALLPSC